MPISVFNRRETKAALIVAFILVIAEALFLATMFKLHMLLLTPNHDTAITIMVVVPIIGAAIAYWLFKPAPPDDETHPPQHETPSSPPDVELGDDFDLSSDLPTPPSRLLQEASESECLTRTQVKKATTYFLHVVATILVDVCIWVCWNLLSEDVRWMKNASRMTHVTGFFVLFLVLSVSINKYAATGLKKLGSCLVDWCLPKIVSPADEPANVERPRDFQDLVRVWLKRKSGSLIHSVFFIGIEVCIMIFWYWVKQKVTFLKDESGEIGLAIVSGLVNLIVDKYLVDLTVKLAGWLIDKLLPDGSSPADESEINNSSPAELSIGSRFKLFFHYLMLALVFVGIEAAVLAIWFLLKKKFPILKDSDTGVTCLSLISGVANKLLTEHIADWLQKKACDWLLPQVIVNHPHGP